ncbi:hypothetical protein [Limnohabitans sp.]
MNALIATNIKSIFCVNSETDHTLIHIERNQYAKQCAHAMQVSRVRRSAGHAGLLQATQVRAVQGLRPHAPGL